MIYWKTYSQDAATLNLQLLILRICAHEIVWLWVIYVFLVNFHTFINFLCFIDHTLTRFNLSTLTLYIISTVINFCFWFLLKRVLIALKRMFVLMLSEVAFEDLCMCMCMTTGASRRAVWRQCRRPWLPAKNANGEQGVSSSSEWLF